MIPLRIRITNFRSFRKTQEFEFPQEPGLYFMTGINESEPRLEANGAGKSTVWEALTWCEHGKTSRGLKAGDVNNWDAGKDTRVEVDYLSGQGEDWTMARTWKPNSWTLRSPDGETHDLTKDASIYAGAAFTPWLNTVLMAQGQPMFLDMKPDAQAALFSEVMGLDAWLGHSSEASNRATALDVSCRIHERALSRIEGEMGALGRNDWRVSVDGWEEERAAKVASIVRQYEGHLNHSTLKADLIAAEEDERNARALLATRQVSAADQKHWGRLRADVSDWETISAMAEKDLKAAEARLEHLSAHDTCDACGQRLPRREHQAELQKARRALDKLTGAAVYAVNQLGGARRDWAAAEIARDEALRLLEEAKDAVGDRMVDVTRARRAVQIEDKELDRLEQEADDLEKAVNPWAAVARDAAADLARLRSERDDTERLLDDCRRQQSVYQMWVRGFKELRLQLIAEALTELEVEANSACSALGLVGWELRFQVDRETKSGGVSRGFSVLVRSPHNELLVPWEAWSGGEAQRLRLAAQMGLADLVRSRSASVLDLEVWDEPTRDLSEAGVQDLLTCLSERALTEGRAIWIVDHRTHAFGGFAGGATIVKAPSGSRIRQSAV